MKTFAAGFTGSLILFVGLLALCHLLGLNDVLIDDGVLIIGRVFAGYLQLIYSIPLILYLRQKSDFRRIANGVLASSIFLIVINTVFFVWMILDPRSFI